MVRQIDKKTDLKRKECILELNKIEEIFGEQVFRSACNRKITIDKQKKQREDLIKKTKYELEQLEKGRVISPY